MKQQILAAVSAAAVLMVLNNVCSAQVSSDAMGKVVPVEIYACSYNSGMGPADLDKVVARWNKYMDDSKNDSYAAWTLTPYYFTAAQEFDVLWMGAFKDGNAMGAGLDDYMQNGGEIQAAFDKVLECNAHIGLSSAMYKVPPNNATPASGVISMMDCKLNEGHEYAEVQAAELKWVSHLTAAGASNGYWHWFPAFGGGDADYDYKIVNAYANFTELGASIEHVANGGGREVSREIFGDIDECDDARVYRAKSRRVAQLR